MSIVSASIQKELNKPLLLTDSQIEFYRKHKFIKIKHILSKEVVAYFNEVITNKVNQLNTETRDMEDRDTFSKAFLQLFNLWRENDEIRKLVFSKRIAGIATQLMGVEGVRLYHDQALYKEDGGGITPWHADQYYWPLNTDKTITAWIPLQETPLHMGPLEFSAGSHQVQNGRELEISDESESQLEEILKKHNFTHVVEPFDVGEISFHSGWLFHRAGANNSGTMRKVMTIIYMDKEMKLKAPENDNQQHDWNTWCPGAKIGEVIDTPINPVLY